MIGGDRGVCAILPVGFRNLPSPVNLSGLAIAGKAFPERLRRSSVVWPEPATAAPRYQHRMPIILPLYSFRSRPAWYTPDSQVRSPGPARKKSGWSGQSSTLQGDKVIETYAAPPSLPAVHLSRIPADLTCIGTCLRPAASIFQPCRTTPLCGLACHVESLSPPGENREPYEQPSRAY